MILRQKEQVHYQHWHNLEIKLKKQGVQWSADHTGGGGPVSGEDEVSQQNYDLSSFCALLGVFFDTF